MKKLLFFIILSCSIATTTSIFSMLIPNAVRRIASQQTRCHSNRIISSPLISSPNQLEPCQDLKSPARILAEIKQYTQIIAPSCQPFTSKAAHTEHMLKGHSLLIDALLASHMIHMGIETPLGYKNSCLDAWKHTDYYQKNKNESQKYFESSYKLASQDPKTIKELNKAILLLRSEYTNDQRLLHQWNAEITQVLTEKSKE